MTSKKSYIAMTVDAILNIKGDATTKSIAVYIKNNNGKRKFNKGFDGYLSKAIQKAIKTNVIQKHEQKEAGTIAYKWSEKQKQTANTRKTIPKKKDAKPPPSPRYHCSDSRTRYKCCAAKEHKVSPTDMDDTMIFLRKQIQRRKMGDIDALEPLQLKDFIMKDPPQQGRIEQISGNVLRYPFYGQCICIKLAELGYTQWNRSTSHAVPGIFREILEEAFPGSQDTQIVTNENISPSKDTKEKISPSAIPPKLG
eukprot:67931_1